MNPRQHASPSKPWCWPSRTPPVSHAATTGLGLINTRVDGAQGLKLHDTLALTPDGVPLGLIDIQVWARDPRQIGQAQQRKHRPIEEKESHRWFKSFWRTAEVAALCPNTRLVNIADREADIYELFQAAMDNPTGADLLVRVNRATRRQVKDDEEHQPLWAFMARQPVLGASALRIPARSGCPARTAALELRTAQVELRPPKHLRAAPTLALWAVYALEADPPADSEPVEWLLLTTVATTTIEKTRERLHWYTLR
jgi:hypothetical protein